MALFIGGAKMEKCPRRDAPGTLSSEDLFIYHLAFRVGFKMSLHPIAAELLGRLNVSPHTVVPNTWRILAVIPSLNAHLDIELGLNELLRVF